MNPSLLKCNQCDFSTMKQSTLSMHKAMKHVSFKKHDCSKCIKSFSVRTQLLHHMANKHTTASIKCPFINCKYISKTSTAVKNHYVRQHMRDENLFINFDAIHSECTTCEHHFKHSAIYYHVAGCSKKSYFYKEQVVKKVHINNRVEELYRDLEQEVDNDEMERELQESSDNQSVMILSELDDLSEILAIANYQIPIYDALDILSEDDQEELEDINDDEMFKALLN